MRLYHPATMIVVCIMYCMKFQNGVDGENFSDLQNSSENFRTVLKMKREKTASDFQSN